MTAHCVSLWIGPALGAVERACLRSMLRLGHEVTLYCYDAVAGVPRGVALRDASEIVLPERIIRHRSGSVALFANLFRYELQRRALGTWVDLDLYLLKPLDGTHPYLFGAEEPGRYSNGVLRLPPDCPMLATLLTLFDERVVPPWLPWRARMAARWRLLRRKRVGLSDMPWGSAGPAALTYLVNAHGLAHHALAPEILYPVHWREARWILDPSRTLERMTGPDTRSVHLYNELIKGFKEAPAPPGSFLARLQREGAPD
ncbi:hypothetical protein [Sphingosinicella sp. BN140058]|uniref:hypothetical protein n=1 Tax=Sphingosinicella sp. BN140058 TaxID=1892855 RepID=UPI001011C582|nr:hypothetical protein [Sphingosinicella sp. BN140058]QAY75498.1 hypothetical protein ETR14_02355 [Sphingosinicella sp. BN140058]